MTIPPGVETAMFGMYSLAARADSCYHRIVGLPDAARSADVSEVIGALMFSMACMENMMNQRCW